MHFYQFHIGDYKAATAHLTNEQDLAYRRLIDLYYDTENAIKNDLPWLSRRLRLNAEVIEVVLQDFFKLDGDVWLHERCQAEIAKFANYIEKQKHNGRLGGRPKNPPLSDGIPTAKPLPTQTEPKKSLTNNHKPIPINQDNTVIRSPNGELVQCDHKAIISLYHETLPTLRRVEVWNDTRSGYLRQRWREVAQELSAEKPADNAAMMKWWRDFFEYVGKSKFLTGKTNDKSGRTFTADLEWMLRPSNFAKIVEGKYHGA